MARPESNRRHADFQVRSEDDQSARDPVGWGLSLGRLPHPCRRWFGSCRRGRRSEGRPGSGWTSSTGRPITGRPGHRRRREERCRRQGGVGDVHFGAMPLKAHVQNGRLVLDEPTDLPEGEVVYLVLVRKRMVHREGGRSGGAWAGKKSFNLCSRSPDLPVNSFSGRISGRELPRAGGRRGLRRHRRLGLRRPSCAACRA